MSIAGRKATSQHDTIGGALRKVGGRAIVCAPVSQPEVRVQLSVIGLNILYAVIGVVLMYASYRVFDILMPEVDVPAELQKGNVAVAIFFASLFIAIALIIGKALG